jgi:hypothetical protein
MLLGQILKPLVDIAVEFFDVQLFESAFGFEHDTFEVALITQLGHDVAVIGARNYVIAAQYIGVV